MRGRGSVCMHVLSLSTHTKRERIYSQSAHTQKERSQCSIRLILRSAAQTHSTPKSTGIAQLSNLRVAAMLPAPEPHTDVLSAFFFTLVDLIMPHTSSFHTSHTSQSTQTRTYIATPLSLPLMQNTQTRHRTRWCGRMHTQHCRNTTPTQHTHTDSCVCVSCAWVSAFTSSIYTSPRLCLHSHYHPWRAQAAPLGQRACIDQLQIQSIPEREHSLLMHPLSSPTLC